MKATIRRWTHGLAVSALILMLALPGGCASTGGAGPQEPQLYTPHFDYQPPETAEPAEADVTFALVNPSYAESPVAPLPGGEASGFPDPFREFARSFAVDFQEMLSERGFSVTGPYESYEQMTYPQRSQADLVLVPRFEFGTRTLQASYSENIKLIGSNTYSFEGTDRLAGQITLAALESLTRERMWYRTIDMPTRDLPWSALREVREEQLPNLLAVDEERISAVFLADNDPGCINVIAPELESYYSEALQTTWDFLNPEEMRHLKSLADSLKANYQPGGE